MIHRLRLSDANTGYFCHEYRRCDDFCHEHRRCDDFCHEHRRCDDFSLEYEQRLVIWLLRYGQANWYSHDEGFQHRQRLLNNILRVLLYIV
jgi:hypothetical protein